MLHRNNDAGAGGDEIHSAAHALDELAGDKIVGHVAVGCDLHRAKDRHLAVRAADHCEGLRRAKRVAKEGVFMMLERCERRESDIDE